MLGPVLAGTAAAAAVAAGYQSMAPTGQWYGRTFTGLARGTRQLALTYDDGPNDPHTFRLLEVLAKHDVYATFFLIGRYVQQRPEIVREVVEAGHVIGNHTFTHPFLSLKSAAEIRQELSDCHSSPARRHRRALQSVPPAVRRTSPRRSAHRPRIRSRTRDVECDRLRLERAAVSGNRAEGDEADSRRRRNPATRRRPQTNGRRPLRNRASHRSPDHEATSKKATDS